MANTIQIRPEHLPLFLYYVENPDEIEDMFLFSYEFGSDRNPPYSYPSFIENLKGIFDGINSRTRILIVPSLDDICVRCAKKEECRESDTKLFEDVDKFLQSVPLEQKQAKLDLFLKYVREGSQTNAFLAQSYSFTPLIGQSFNISELIQIRDRKSTPHYLCF